MPIINKIGDSIMVTSESLYFCKKCKRLLTLNEVSDVWSNPDAECTHGNDVEDWTIEAPEIMLSECYHGDILKNIDGEIVAIGNVDEDHVIYKHLGRQGELEKRAGQEWHFDFDINEFMGWYLIGSVANRDHAIHREMPQTTLNAQTATKWYSSIGLLLKWVYGKVTKRG